MDKAVARHPSGQPVAVGDQLDELRAAAASMPAPQRPSQSAAPKIGRNDPCPCGSGKKFKKCHGAALEEDEGGGDDEEQPRA
jgi:preprotein translocase subunit SecA